MTPKEYKLRALQRKLYTTKALRNPRGEVKLLHSKDAGMIIKYTTATGKDCSCTTALKKFKYFSTWSHIGEYPLPQGVPLSLEYVSWYSCSGNLYYEMTNGLDLRHQLILLEFFSKSPISFFKRILKLWCGEP